jgi:hypothetical protein
MALYARLSLPLQAAKVRFHSFEKKSDASLAAGPCPALAYSPWAPLVRLTAEASG